MGGSVAQGAPNQVASGSFYGVLNQPNLGKPRADDEAFPAVQHSQFSNQIRLEAVGISSRRSMPSSSES